MAKWRIWFWSLFLLFCLGAAALTAAVWNNLNTEWQVVDVTAQAALNDSPINAIDEHSVFTGQGVQEVFRGSDAFGRKWYTFVSADGSDVHYIAADQLVSSLQIMKELQPNHLTGSSLHLGYVDSGSLPRLQTSSHFVWEVYGQNSDGHSEYRYFDALTGRFLWKYVLST